MDIHNQILGFTEKHSLKEKALASIDAVLDASIESDNEIGIDFLNGNSRSDLIYEFGRFELRVDGNDNCKIVTRIKIYSKELYGANLDMSVGYYEEWTDLEGMHLDEFLVFDWSPINLNIDCYIARINKTVPQRYFRRNIPEYEYATYVNHAISLFQGKQFEGAILFIKRCIDYLEKNGNKKIVEEYLSECLELFQGIYHFVKNRDLIEIKTLDKHRINERIKNEKLAIAKKS